MARSKRSASAGFLSTCITTRWIYDRDGGQQVRRQAAPTRPEAEQIAAQLTSGAPTLLAFASIGVAE